MNLYFLRICLTSLWLVYLGQVIAFEFYDPTLYSPLLHLGKIILDRSLKDNWLFFGILILESFLLIYASAALWFGYYSGKLTICAYLFFGLIDNYFVTVHALSWIVVILLNLYFLILGMILMGVMSKPLKTQLSKAKPFHFWKVFAMFFVFFILYFSLPLSFNYLF